MTCLRPSLLTLTLIALPALAQSPAPSSELNQRLEALSAELAQVKAQIGELQRQPAPAATEAATTLTGYGEINFRFFTQGDRGRNEADLRRFVIGVSHRFDDRTRLVTELEVEHAVASADDPGEVEVEQAYLEHQLNGTWGLRAGLFLMPVGLLNEHHEPTSFYGVDRNSVETAIIPSTWREGGIQAYADFENGLSFQAGLCTGFNLGKWDAASGEGRESPLASVHQELVQAKSHDFAGFVALNWRGWPGLLLGGSWFQGGASQGQAGLPAMTVTLGDLHARWTPGPWDLSALASFGHISHTAEFNLTQVGQSSLVPERFSGWYVQAAHHLWSSGSYALTPFLRYEASNTGQAYADLGPGLTPAKAEAQGIWTVGANFNLAPRVVIKADIQRFRQDRDQNRVNLGFGWSF